MSQDPIEHLLSEHRDILARIERLEEAVAALEAEGEAALPSVLPLFVDVAALMATRLDVHRQKEDDVLFPAVEAILGEAGSPTAVMRQEHRDIHAQGVLLRETLHELNAVQHPAIEASGAALRALLADGEASEATAGELQRLGSEIGDLLHSHFEKEEQILFPMARQLLEQQTLAHLAERFAAMDDAEGPDGKKTKFPKVIDKE